MANINFIRTKYVRSIHKLHVVFSTSIWLQHRYSSSILFLVSGGNEWGPNLFLSVCLCVSHVIFNYIQHILTYFVCDFCFSFYSSSVYHLPSVCIVINFLIVWQIFLCFVSPYILYEQMGNKRPFSIFRCHLEIVIFILK